MIVRDAVVADMPRLVALYNALITTTTIAWTEDLQTLEQRNEWFASQMESGFPVLVADDGEQIVGFTSYGSFRGAGKWPGYEQTVEHTIHVDESFWGRGVGRKLVEALVDRARGADIHVMVGAVDADNVESIVFHQRLGFIEVARMPEVGRKFDRWLDLVLMQRIL